MPIALRRPDRTDSDALVALQALEAGTAPPLSVDGVRVALFDEARGHGGNVRVALDDGGAIVGAIAWVHGPGVMFAAPFIAPRRAVADALLDALFVEAAQDGPDWIRTSTGSPTSPRAQALAARGFAPRFDFVDYTRATLAAIGGAPPDGTRVVDFVALDRARLLALYNQTFDGAPNALPLSPTQLDEAFDGPLTFSPGTAALIDDAGAYVGFLHADRVTDAAGAHVTVEAVGVAPRWRGRNVGAWLIDRLLGAAAAAGVPEARALIASTNLPSIALHSRLGFVERFRRHVWEWRRC